MQINDQEVKPGLYRHYKGGMYEVFFVAKHTETLEDVVVYRSLSECRTGGVGSMWVRPKAMFCEDVEQQGVKIPRFTLVEPAKASDISQLS